MLKLSVLFILFYSGAIHALPFITDNCIKYAELCEINEECCYFPMTMCLPNIENSTSCLSPLDIINLNAEFAGSDIISPLVENLGNATMAIVEVVEIDGVTVYNNSKIITGNSTGITVVNGTVYDDILWGSDYEDPIQMFVT